MIAVQKLALAIQRYNINLYELFKKYDKSENDSLEEDVSFR